MGGLIWFITIGISFLILYYNGIFDDVKEFLSEIRKMKYIEKDELNLIVLSLLILLFLVILPYLNIIIAILVVLGMKEKLKNPFFKEQRERYRRKRNGNSKKSK